MEWNTQTVLIIFVALTGIAVLLQACVLLGILISLRKAVKSMTEATEDIKVTVLPMVHSTRELLERITPEILTVTAGLSELTTSLRRESKGVSVSVSEIMQRVSRQAKRLDELLTVGLNTVEKAGGVLESAVAVPVRQANGLLAAAKAIIETYRSETPRRKPTYSYPVAEPQADPDRDMAI